MMNLKNKIAALCVAGQICLLSGAQSQNFKLGQWMEIQNSVMRSLARYYVDSLPLDRMYQDGMEAMLSDLDPYTVYVPESEQDQFEMMISNTYGGIGAIIYKPDVKGNVIINEPYENTPAARAGLRCGDEIMLINGESVVGMQVGDASSKMKGESGTNVAFRVKKVRTGEIEDIVITRERIHTPDVEYYGMLDDTTGYVYQAGFTSGVSRQLQKALIELKGRGMKRLVYDLRGNGGGLLDEAVRIVSLFVPKGTLVVTSKGSDGEMKNFTRSEPVDTLLPVCVLVDSGSASASEIVAGALQDLDRGVIMGHRTFGKGLVQKIVPLSYNGSLKVTTSKYYTPSGRCVQAKDYSHREEDGSVGAIPDSLTREFKTAGGRSVRDGGGITPDVELASESYNRVSYAVIAYGLTNNYPVEFARRNDSIPAPSEFHMSDAQYSDFVEWALTQNFDSRSEAQTYFDKLVSELKKDGLYDSARTSLDSLGKVVRMDKRNALILCRSQIQPVLEEEISVRYHFQFASHVIRLRNDRQLESALLWMKSHPDGVKSLF